MNSIPSAMIGRYSWVRNQHIPQFSGKNSQRDLRIFPNHLKIAGLDWTLEISTATYISTGPYNLFTRLRHLEVLNAKGADCSYLKKGGYSRQLLYSPSRQELIPPGQQANKEMFGRSQRPCRNALPLGIKQSDIAPAAVSSPTTSVPSYALKK